MVDACPDFAPGSHSCGRPVSLLPRTQRRHPPSLAGLIHLAWDAVMRFRVLHAG